MSLLLHETQSSTFITTKEASDISGYNSDYLGRLAREGKVQGMQVGRTWVIDRASLETFIEEQKTRKAERAEELAREREREYRRAQQPFAKASKVMSSVVSELRAPSHPVRVTRTPLFASAVALSVVVLCAFVSTSQAMRATMALVPEVAVRAAQSVAYSVSPETPPFRPTDDGAGREILTASVPRASDVTGYVAGYAQDARNPYAGMRAAALESTIAQDGMDRVRSIAHALMHPKEFAQNAVYAYRVLGHDLYTLATMAGDGYEALLWNTGEDAVTRAGIARDAVRTVPVVTELTYRAYEDALYAWVDTTPRIADRIVTDTIALGGFLGGVASYAPSGLRYGTERAALAWAEGSLALMDAVVAQEAAAGDTLARAVGSAASSVRTEVGRSLAAVGSLYGQADSDTPVREADGAEAESRFSTTLLGIAGTVALMSEGSPNDVAAARDQLAASAVSVVPASWQMPVHRLVTEAAELTRALARGVMRGIAQLVPSVNVISPQLTVIPFSEGEPFGIPSSITDSLPQQVSGPIASGSNAVQTIINNYFPQTIIQGPSEEAIMALVRPYVQRSVDSIVRNGRGGGGGGTSGGGTGGDAVDLSNVEITGGTAILSSLTAGSSTIGTLTATSGSFTTLSAGTTTLGTTTIAGDLTISGTLTAGTLSVSSLSSGEEVIAPFFTATSTTATNTFPNLSATNANISNLTAANATTTNLFTTLLTATNGIFSALSADDADLGNLVVGNSTTTNATTTNLYASFANIVDAVFGEFTATLANIATAVITDLTATNGVFTNATSTNATSTNLYAQNLTAGNAVLTNATSTNFYADSGVFTDAEIQTLTGTTATFSSTTITSATFGTSTTTQAAIQNLTATNATSTNFFATLLTADDGIFASLFADLAVFGNSTTTNATTTNLYASLANIVDAVFGSFTATLATIATAVITDLTATDATITNLSGTNAVLVNATSTNATSTTLYAESLRAGAATTTALYTSNLGLGGSTFTSLLGTGLVNSGGALSVSTSSLNLDATYFRQGGNAFGTGAVLGTTDAQSLSVVSNNTTRLTVTSGGSIGIATTSPSFGFSVATTSYLAGNAILGASSANTVTIAGQVNSHIIPSANGAYDLGSASNFWRRAYVDELVVTNLSAASTTVSGTVSDSFIINSNNLSADSEDSTLVFHRGTEAPHAIITWNSTDDRFDFNMPINAPAATFTNATATNLTTTSFTLDGDTFTSFLGNGLANISGTLSVATSTFSGSGSLFNADLLDGFDSTYFLANSFSTTSADYWQSARNFFSTTSAAYYLSTLDKGFFFSTTSSNYWLTTKTTSDLAEGTNLYYTDARVNAYVAASSTIPKTYAANTFSGAQVFTGGLTTNSFTLGTDTFSSFLGNGLTNVGGVLTVSTTSLGSGFFQQGGNSFGATATIGTTDLEALEFITNNTQAGIFDTSGNLAITGSFTPGDQVIGISDTASNPAFTFAGDLTTGIYHAGSNLIGFSTGGVGRMVLDANGYLGIGTTSPSEALSVAGDGLFSGDLFVEGGLTSGSFTLDSDTFTSFLGTGLANISGTLSVATSTFSGSGSLFNADLLDGFDSTYFLANGYSTTSANYWLTTKTTSDLAEGTNLYYTDARVNAYVAASSTIPKTYTANTFSGAQAFTGGVTIGTLTGPLQAVNGVVSATSTLSVAYGGTGLSTAPIYGQLLVGTGTGGYALTATSSLGLVTSVDASGGTTGLTFSGGPVTTSGTLTLGGTLGVGNGGTGATLLSGILIGNGTSPVTATTLSSGIAGQLSDETGTGSLVFSASPTFTGTAVFANASFVNATSTSLYASTFGLGGSYFTSFLGNGLTNVGGALTVSTTSLGSGFFQQGGNSFGTTATLGTNDSNALVFETNNTEALRINTDGQLVSNIGSTASVPSFTWDGDVTTGIFHPAANQIGFSTGGIQRAVLDANGYLGIGTTSPSEALSVAGDGLFSGDLFVEGGLTSGSFTLDSDTFTSFLGTGLANISGTLSVATSTFSGSGSLFNADLLDGFDSTYFLANSFSTTSADYWQSARNFFSTTSSNYWLTTKTTTDLAEGANLYFTNARADARINATSTIGTLLSAPNLATVGTITSGVWQGTAIADAYLTKSGNWTGTFDGQEGTYYLDRANHTGTQLASTISDFASAARALFSSSATGLTYTSATGDFSLTAGYVIPLSASTTEWAAFYATPSTRITAGNGLSWSGNTLNVSTSSLGSGFFQQGGNSFGTTATLGTNDSNALVFETNNTEALRINTDGQLVSNIGSVASVPSFTFSGDLTTGIFHPASNAIGFSTGGIERAVIDGNGFLGIGTTSPMSILSIQGANPTVNVTASGGSGTASLTLNGNFTNWSIRNQLTGGADNDLFGIYNSSLAANAISINRSSNNVGIGTTSPTATLSVAGTGLFTGQLRLGTAFTGSLGNRNESLVIAASSVDPSVSTMTSRVSGKAAFTTTNSTLTLYGSIISAAVSSANTANWSGTSPQLFGQYIDALTEAGSTGTINRAAGVYVNVGGTGAIIDKAVAVSAAFSGASTNSVVGFQAGYLAVASNATGLYLTTTDGNSAVPGTWGIYDETGYNSYLQGSLGLGTTSPYAKLSVVGQTVSEYFTATSTSATSTLPNLLATNLRLTGSLYDGTNSAGTNGYVLQSTASGTQWVATSTLSLPDTFIHNGNSLGTDAYLGTNDSNALVFETNNVEALRINTDRQLVSSIGSTASVPSFTFSGDLTTGIFHPASNAIGFSTGGVQRALIDGNGYLGIGTTTPYRALSVAGDGAFTGTLGIGDFRKKTTTDYVVSIGRTLMDPTVRVIGTNSEIKLGYTATNVSDIHQAGAFAGMVHASNTADWTESDYPSLIGVSGSIGVDSGSSGTIRFSAGVASIVGGTFPIGTGATLDEVTMFWGDPANGDMNYLVGAKITGLAHGVNNTGLLLGIAQNGYPPTGNYGIYDRTGYNSYLQGSLGLGTTSPYAKLSVVGQTVSEYFTATSTTATSTFPNLLSSNIRLTGRLYDGSNSSGTNGYVLQSTGTGTQWVATSTLGFASAADAFIHNGNSYGTDAYLGTNDSNALVFETNNVERMRLTSAGRLGIGTTTPAGTLGIDGGSLASLQPALSVMATLNSTAATQQGVYINVTGSGSAASGAQRALDIDMLAGYTGSAPTAAGSFTNYSAGTGSTLLANTSNHGVIGTARGSTTGENVGVAGFARSGLLNIGVYGRAPAAINSGVNVGVLGYANNTGTGGVRIGAYFGILDNTEPTFDASAALIADNGASTDPILLLRDNGSTVVSVIDGGSVGLGTTTPTARLAITGAGIGTGRAFAVANSLNVERFTILDNGSVGIGTTSPYGRLSVTDTADANNHVTTYRASTGDYQTGIYYAGDQRVLLTNNAYSGFGTSYAANNGNGGIRLGSGGNYSYIVGGGTNLLLQPVSGNVGIGTISPSYKLDVVGDVNISANSGYKQNGATILYASTTNFSTLVGNGAGAALNASGVSNTAVGYQALLTATSSDYNTAIGYQALRSLNDTSLGYNTAVGHRSLYSAVAGSYYNTALGANSLTSMTTGTQNNAFGYNTLAALTTGFSNNAFGMDALSQATTAFNNVAIGTAAGQTITSGGGNVALGVSALGGGPTTVSNTIAIGNNSLRYNNGNNNVAIGADTGSNASAAFAEAVLIGRQAGGSLTTGASNTLIGYRAGFNLTTGGSNIIIGAAVDAPSASDSNQLNIGNTIYGNLSSGRVGIGTSSPIRSLSVNGSAPQLGLGVSGVERATIGVDSSSNLTLATGGTTYVTLSSAGALRLHAYGTGTLQTDASGNVTASSDERLKDITGSFSRGLADLESLSPILYRWNGVSGLDRVETYAGFSAQNVQSAIPEAVGVDPRGYLTLQDRPILAASVNAIKELAGRTDTLSFATTSLSTRLSAFEAQWVAAQEAAALPQDLTATVVTAESLEIAAGVSAGSLHTQTATIDGTVSAARYVVPATAQVFSLGSTTVTVTLPDDVLTGGSADLYKVATYALASVQALADRAELLATRIDDIETRVAFLEAQATATSSASQTAQGALGLAASAVKEALEAFGIFVEQGLARLNTLMLRQLVFTQDENGMSSAGSVTIPAGDTEVEVQNAFVMPTSKIFVTFTSAVEGSWYLTDKRTGSFTVKLSEAQGSDVSFDYFLVQTEGQVASALGSQPEAGDETAPVPEPPPAISEDGGPTVSLIGGAAVQIPQGASWSDPGATATAADGTDLTSSIAVDGGVDAATPGLYTVTYRATDAEGRFGEVSRIVSVLAPTMQPSEPEEPPQVASGGGDPAPAPEPAPEPEPEPAPAPESSPTESASAGDGTTAS